MISYDFEEERVLRFLKKQRAKKAGVQLPAGLKPFWSKISEYFRRAGVAPILLGSCYGACDLADVQARGLRCDVLVHYGHADMGLPSVLPTLYVESRVSGVVFDAVEKFVDRAHRGKIGLFTSVQYLGHLQRVEGILREAGFTPVVGKGGCRAKYRGQVLGCDFGCVSGISRRVEAFLYFGSGRFHPLGAALATRKEVFAADPITGGLSRVGGLGDFLRSRRAAISKAAGGQKFGVVASVKRGQARFALASSLIEGLREKGKQAELVVVDELSPEPLGDFGFDALVCTACPRIPIDDADRYEVPILTPFELKVMFGDAQIEFYQLDEFVGKGL